MVSASPYKEKITLDFILFFVTSALNKKKIQLKSTNVLPVEGNYNFLLKGQCEHNSVVLSIS